MSIGTVKPGFMGFAKVNGTVIRCTDFNVNPLQDALFFDHTLGLRDKSTHSSNFTTLKGEGKQGEFNKQKRFWRPGVKIYQGNIAFPLTSKTGTPFFDYAKKGTDFDLDFVYACGIGREFKGCRVNGYEFSLTAGDICNVSVEIMAAFMQENEFEDESKEEKIITWDDFNIGIVNPHFNIDAKDVIQSFNFSVKNNCMPVYTAGGNSGGGFYGDKLGPIRIRVGMQEVTGTVSCYNKGGALGFMENIPANSPSKISIKTKDAFNTDLNVIFKPQERAGTIGPVITNIPFVGVDYALGE